MRRLIITSDEIKNSINNLGLIDTNYQTIDMVQPIVGLREFGITRISFPKTWYTVDRDNNFFTLAQGATTWNIIMDTGNYTATSFMSMLKEKMEEATSVNNNIYNITEENGHFIFEIESSDTTPVEIILIFGMPSSLTGVFSNISFRTLGFNNNSLYRGTEVSEPGIITAPLIFNLSGGDVKLYLDFPELNTQRSENFNSKSDTNHLFETLPVGGNSGEYQYYEPISPYIHKIDYSINLTKLTPQFYWVISGKRYPVDFKGQSYEIVCRYSTKLSRKEDDQENFY